MNETKLVFLIADGMGDKRLAALGDRTPLEAAHTPNMDRLATRCIAGTAATVPDGMQAGSDVACMSLMGFSPKRYHTGRGPIEAAARCLDLRPNDIIWRLNLVSVSQADAAGIMQDFTAGNISSTESKALIRDLEENLGDSAFTFVPGLGYRHLLIERGGAVGISSQLNIRPPHDIIGSPIDKDLTHFASHPRLESIFQAAAKRLGRSDNRTAANAIWPWGQGKPLSLPNFQETYGFRGAVVSAVDLIKGLGHAAGLRVLDIDGATGTLDTDYAAKVRAAIHSLRSGEDFVFLHVEGPDDCAHSGDMDGKVEAIARFDRDIVGPLIDGTADMDVAILIACDHYTPLTLRVHTATPVPFLLYHRTAGAHTLPSFTEKAANTGLTINPGYTLMRRVIERIRQ